MRAFRNFNQKNLQFQELFSYNFLKIVTASTIDAIKVMTHTAIKNKNFAFIE